MAAEFELVNVSTRIAGSVPVDDSRTEYFALAAGSTTILSTAATLTKLVVVPNTTGAGAVTLSDGTTAILTIPAAAHAIDPHPYSVDLNITNESTAGFKLVLGASVAALVAGSFSGAATTA